MPERTDHPTTAPVDIIWALRHRTANAEAKEVAA